jgi:hypothetical protein
VSNAHIIARIKEELAAFERKERTADQLETILAAHFEAIEGIPYSRLKALHHFEYRLVKAQFADEDPRIESSEAVLAQLRVELAVLEKEANQTSEPTAPSGRGSP